MSEEKSAICCKEGLTGYPMHVHDGVAWRAGYDGLCIGCTDEKATSEIATRPDIMPDLDVIRAQPMPGVDTALGGAGL